MLTFDSGAHQDVKSSRRCGPDEVRTEIGGLGTSPVRRGLADTGALSREDNRMPKKIQCVTHGECQEAFVCTHLLGETAGLGFNRNEPSTDNPFPDAWCDNCEL